MESCGPSTALSSLKHHVEADRSLYQNRLRPLLVPSQAFRTQENSGLDEYAEWDSRSGFDNRTFNNIQRSLLPQYERADLPSSWTNDFQRMNMGSRKGKERFGWPNEFHMNTVIQDKQMPDHSLRDRTSAYITQNSMYYEPQMLHQLPQQTSQIDIDAENALFEAAFSQFPQENRNQEQTKEDKKKDYSEMDALARTAGQLIESVNHDTSEKFQNSAFFGLMRRIRDKEIVVEGEKMVERIERI
ncbi:hypothetical protein NEOLI_001751 [Neolecta irregularis DAH-3]|uniref:Peroxin 20 n=1 Tax=Neolecta irregularis (strain DAH-3) TaxID=1198029 RepID=A0A1U7LWC6_NEOID|nr:hypothetical protein NEOLI_001751 [Neolecta irregularis DAH-3]|eukprot:OLL26873.1 hypothetical protein NEOLI_001751 [Neolecta irregularis DAH-3]